ncbi:MAG: zinc-binding dehydrogenase [Chloroflexi bacterium]|nr:zinc-binding dehydrogenase [Chloroflexota bacterium]
MTTTYRKLIAARHSKNFRDAIEIVESPLRDPAPRELLLRTRCTGVNAADRIMAAGAYIAATPVPFDLGGEAVGEVVAVGAQVQHYRPGDAVLTLGGGYSEYSYHPETRVFPIPRATPEIVSLGVGGLTASIALEVVGEMKSGETVLVTAAAGGTGHFAVQLAKLAGNHVIGTCSSDDKAGLLRTLGCDRPVNYRRENLHDVLKSEYPKGVHIVFESVGGDLFDTGLRHLAVRGRLITIGYIAEYDTGAQKVEQARVYSYLLPKSASVRGFWLNHFLRDHAPAHLLKLVGLLDSGKLTAEVDSRVFRGLEAVADAVEYLYSGQNHGKVVVSY